MDVTVLPVVPAFMCAQHAPLTSHRSKRKPVRVLPVVPGSASHFGRWPSGRKALLRTLSETLQPRDYLRHELERSAGPASFGKSEAAHCRVRCESFAHSTMATLRQAATCRYRRKNHFQYEAIGTSVIHLPLAYSSHLLTQSNTSEKSNQA